MAVVSTPVSAKLDPCSPDRCRRRFIEAAGRELEIPRHIVRLCVGNSSGWNVTFESPTRYFGDNAHGGVEQALAAAREYLRLIWRPIPKDTRRGLDPRTGKPTDAIQLVRKEHVQHGLAWFVQTTHPNSGEVWAKYVGNKVRPPLGKVRAARIEARAKREAWLRESPIPLR